MRKQIWLLNTNTDRTIETDARIGHFERMDSYRSDTSSMYSSTSSFMSSQGSNRELTARAAGHYVNDSGDDNVLEFQTGDIINVVNNTDDDEWWYGYIMENGQKREGYFPASFVVLERYVAAARPVACVKLDCNNTSRPHFVVFSQTFLYCFTTPQDNTARHASHSRPLDFCHNYTAAVSLTSSQCCEPRLRCYAQTACKRRL
jgi:hypothetical protein